MGFEFKIARTESEKEEIYRLRYKIYVEEMNRSSNADHEKKMIKDWMDERGVHFYVTTGNKMVATARMNFTRFGKVEFEEEYEIERFKPHYPDAVSTTTKLMVSPGYRKSSLTARFVAFLYNYSKAQGICLDFINVNHPLVSFYKRMGYRDYKSNFSHPEFGEVIPMVLEINDIDYLKKIKSPFVRVKKACDETQLHPREYEKEAAG